MSVTVKINDRAVQVPDGASVLDAINASGVYLSQLCRDPDMGPIGACRTCLVQIEGTRGLPASCSVPVRDGMQVWTETSEVQRIRKGVLELTLAMLPENGSSDYQQLSVAAEQHGIATSGRRWTPRAREAVDETSPVFNIAMEACILCGRCAEACQDGAQFIGAIDVLGSAGSSRIGTFMDRPLAESICTTCGQCLSVCPTGAIHAKPPMPVSAEERDSSVASFTLSRAAGLPQNDSLRSVILSSSEKDEESRADAYEGGEGKRPILRSTVKSVTTTCPYCGVGCGIKLQVDDNDRIFEVLDDPENRSSMGMLCVKGRFGYTYVHHSDRLTTPLIRVGPASVPGGDGQGVRGKSEFRTASWDEALDYVTERLATYRGAAFATLCSAKATNEDGYIQQKFARLIMQSNNIDHCTRLCHSPSVEAMLTSLGSGATSNSYTDYEDAGCLLITGADPTSNHPVAASRMRKAIVERGAKLIVINPRRIDMCDYAELWLRPYPGTDVALLNAMAKVILDEGLDDTEFVAHRTEGFEEWKAVVDKYAPEYTETVTGVPARDIREAARLYARPPFSGSCLIWGMGITQHTNGTANAHGLLNLALVAGQMGRPGSGISPLRGQNNVQGCGDAGCVPDSFPGYQAIGVDSVRKFQEAWSNVPLPSTGGLVITEMVEAAREGRVKAMYITGENPLLSEPDLKHAREALDNLEFLVVQDIFMHETAEIADVVLPGASFAEKDGTFTNSERRVQRVRRAIEPIGQSRPDWEIICDLARRMCGKLGTPLEHEFSHSHPSEIWAEMARLTPLFSGISYERLEQEGGIQWPCPTPDHPGTPYLYADSFPRGPRAAFVAFDQGEVAAETPSPRFPLVLNTGRTLYHWHGGTLTRRVPGLLSHEPELRIALNPDDGQRYGIADGEWIVLRSRRGELEGRAAFTEKMRAGEVFVPFVRLAESAANFLTNAAFDPTSKIPEYKVCAVRIDKIGDGGRTKGSSAGRLRRGKRRVA